jgi:hypothetical protein
MEIAEILGAIDSEIALLKQARALLGGTAAAGPGKKAGKFRKAAAAKPTGARQVRRKRGTLSAEGRKRIAEAQKRRWEAQKKAAAATQK